MYEIKCLIVSDGITKVSILILCTCSVRSGAEGWLKLLECSLSLLLLHFLPLAFFFFLSNLSFKLAALRHCLHLETQFQQAFPSIRFTGNSHTLESKCKENWPAASCSEDGLVCYLRFQVRIQHCRVSLWSNCYFPLLLFFFVSSD